MKTGKFILCSIIMLMLAAPQAFAASEIKWQPFDSAVKKSGTGGKLIYLYFNTDWCGYCRKMEKETFSDPRVAQYLNQEFIPVSINPEKDKKGGKVASAFRVRGFPASGFSPDGEKAIAVQPGFIPPDMFLVMLKYLGSGSYKKMSFESFMKNKKNQ